VRDDAAPAPAPGGGDQQVGTRIGGVSIGAPIIGASIRCRATGVESAAGSVSCICASVDRARVVLQLEEHRQVTRTESSARHGSGVARSAVFRRRLPGAREAGVDALGVRLDERALPGRRRIEHAACDVAERARARCIVSDDRRADERGQLAGGAATLQVHLEKRSCACT
jgi:hypothetical protein